MAYFDLLFILAPNPNPSNVTDCPYFPTRDMQTPCWNPIKSRTSVHGIFILDAFHSYSCELRSSLDFMNCAFSLLACKDVSFSDSLHVQRLKQGRCVLRTETRWVLVELIGIATNADTRGKCRKIRKQAVWLRKVGLRMERTEIKLVLWWQIHRDRLGFVQLKGK